MRNQLALLVCALAVAGCGSHDRTQELQQEKLTVDLMKAQNDQLAASLKAQDEKLAALTKKENSLRALEKENQETLREIKREKATIETLRERMRRDEATAREEAGPQNKKRKVDAVLVEARKLFKNRDLEKAFVVLSNAIEEIGPHHDLLVARGCVLLGDKQGYDAAIADFTEAIRLDSKDAQTLQRRGIAYARAGKPARAIVDLDSAMKLDPALAPYCCLLKGKQYLRQKDFVKAIAELTEAARLDPLNEEVFFHRGLAYAALADADDDIVRARQTFGDLKAAYFNNANCWKAATDFREAIRLSPDSTEAKEALASLEEKAQPHILTQKERAAWERKAAESTAAAEKEAAERKAAAEKEAGERERNVKAEVVESCAQSWLALVDKTEYEQSWEVAADYLKEKVDKKDFVKQLSGVRTPLGKVVSRQLESKQYATTLPGAPDGEYVVLKYKTSFEHRKSATETITPMFDKHKNWCVSGYYIK